MGLTRSEQEAQLTKWLNNVDQCFAEAMRRRNATLLEKYIERNCLLEQLDLIMHGVPEYHGIERYKIVTWTRVSAKNGILVYRKTVEYQNINFSKYVRAKVGDNFTEDWWLQKIDGNVFVTNIIRYDAWEMK